jgi:hypothetical protein
MALNRQSLLANKALVFAISVQVALIAIRTANLYATGFVTSDEANYAVRAMDGILFPNRYFFDITTISLFKLFGINSASGFFAIFPFFLAFWGISFIVVTYKVLGLLTKDTAVRDFTVFTLPFIITYSLLSVGFLTETTALTLAMAGIYCWVRYFKVRRSHYLPFLSSAALVAAAYSREPYMVFPVLGVVAWFLLAALRKAEVVDAFLFLVPALLMLVPTYSPFLPLVTGAFHVILSSQPATTTVVTSSATASGGPGSNLTSTTVASSAPSAPALSLLATLGTATFLFFGGIALGWNPLLFCIGVGGFALIVYQFAKRKFDFAILSVVLLGLATVFLLDVLFVQSTGFFTGQGLSTLIRYANPSVTAYVLIAPFVYEKLSRNRRIIIAALLIVLVVAGFGEYSHLSQTNLSLPYNAMGFGNKYGPLVARDYFLSFHGTTTTAFISADWKAGQLYLRDISGLSIYPTFAQPNPINESQFVQMHLPSYYILSAGTLNPTNVTTTILSLGLSPPFPAFILEPYEKVYNQTVQSVDGYTVTAAKVVFASPSGNMLMVNVSWSQ